jgi:hypothetical protein
MPWTAADAQAHTRKAVTPRLRRLWASVANAALARGDGEGAAIREASAAVARETGGREEAEPNARGTPAARASRWL